MNFIKTLAVICILGFLGGCAETKKAADTAPSLPRSEQALAESLGVGAATWGYLVIGAETGEVLEERNSEKEYPPASTAKLPTMVAALNILQPTYRFSTRLLARGSLQSGVLSGDLILTGNGDPLLSAGDLRALAVRLKDIGIERVDGRFLYHSEIPSFPEVEPTQPATAPYNQGLSGLNLEFNRVVVTRSDTVAYVTPMEASALTPVIDLGPESERDAPVQYPDTLSARVFARFANIEGIRLPKPEAGAPPANSVTLAEIRSQPLIEIARAGLEYSNNMVAEVIGLASARALGSPADTLQTSTDRVGIWLERNVDGLEGFATALNNHSGLSTRSRVSPRQMTAILAYALKQRFDGWRIDSLMTPGGTRDALRGRFRDPETAYRVWAKSGTMRYIKGLIGYLDATSGKRLIFALYVYDPELRAKLEADPDRYGYKARRASSEWRRATDEFEAALIRRWIMSH